MSLSPCPACRAPEPGLVVNAFGSPRVRCASCGAWLVPTEGGLREEDPLLLPCLRAADAAVQELDSGATYSRRRRFLLERGLRGSAVDDALRMLDSVMPVPRGELPEGWVRFVETRRAGGYREAAQSTRTLHVRRRGRLVTDAFAALVIGGYFGAVFYDAAPWMGIVAGLVPLGLLVARLQTTRWSLGPERWAIPGRWFGRTIDVDPKTIEWISVTRERVKGSDLFGLTLRAEGVDHVLMHPSRELSEESAHGLARLLEEHAGLVPRRLSAKVRVERAERATEQTTAAVEEETSRRTDLRRDRKDERG